MRNPQRLEKRQEYSLLLLAMGMSYREVGKCLLRRYTARTTNPERVGRNAVAALLRAFAVDTSTGIVTAGFRYGFLRWHNDMLESHGISGIPSEQADDPPDMAARIGNQLRLL